jgi:hypothetical protein
MQYDKSWEINLLVKQIITYFVWLPSISHFSWQSGCNQVFIGTACLNMQTQTVSISVTITHLLSHSCSQTHEHAHTHTCMHSLSHTYCLTFIFFSHILSLSVTCALEISIGRHTNLGPNHDWSSQFSACQCRGQDKTPGKYRCGLWWTKWQWDRFISSTLSHSVMFVTLIMSEFFPAWEKSVHT